MKKCSAMLFLAIKKLRTFIFFNVYSKSVVGKCALLTSTTFLNLGNKLWHILTSYRTGPTPIFFARRVYTYSSSIGLRCFTSWDSVTPPASYSLQKCIFLLTLQNKLGKKLARAAFTLRNARFWQLCPWHWTSSLWIDEEINLCFYVGPQLS